MEYQEPPRSERRLAAALIRHGLAADELERHIAAAGGRLHLVTHCLSEWEEEFGLKAAELLALEFGECCALNEGFLLEMLGLDEKSKTVAYHLSSSLAWVERLELWAQDGVGEAEELLACLAALEMTLGAVERTTAYAEGPEWPGPCQVPWARAMRDELQERAMRHAGRAPEAFRQFKAVHCDELTGREVLVCVRPGRTSSLRSAVKDGRPDGHALALLALYPRSRGLAAVVPRAVAACWSECWPTESVLSVELRGGLGGAELETLEVLLKDRWGELGELDEEGLEELVEMARAL